MLLFRTLLTPTWGLHQRPFSLLDGGGLPGACPRHKSLLTKFCEQGLRNRVYPVGVVLSFLFLFRMVGGCLVLATDVSLFPNPRKQVFPVGVVFSFPFLFLIACQFREADLKLGNDLPSSQTVFNFFPHRSLLFHFSHHPNFLPQGSSTMS